MQARCMKDKKEVKIVNPKKVTLKNGRIAVQGTCPDCGGKVSRLTGKAATTEKVVKATGGSKKAATKVVEETAPVTA